jgi:hypothetical protein
MSKDTNLFKTIAATQEMVQSYIQANKIQLKNLNDGDIFQLTRGIQDNVRDNENVKLTNTIEIYNWIIEYRDELKNSNVSMSSRTDQKF